MDGYLVQQPWADQIANGEKRWDVRTVDVRLPRNKTIYILSTMHPHQTAPKYPVERLGRIVATARCTEVIGPLDIEEMVRHQDKHLIDTETLRAYSRGHRLYAMVFSDVKRVEPARPYRQRPGAVHLLTNVDE
jgi:hypothetical protein